MDPIDVADIVLEMGAGVFVVLFSAAFGVSITPITKPRNFPKNCIVASYEDSSIVASILACFAALSVLWACTIKRTYKRAANGNPEANSIVAWRLVYALIPLASMTYILAFILFVMVNQYRLGKIECWSLATQVFIFGACIFAVIAAFIIGIIGYYYGRDLDDDLQFFTAPLSPTVTRERSLGAAAAAAAATTDVGAAATTDVEAATTTDIEAAADDA